MTVSQNFSTTGPLFKGCNHWDLRSQVQHLLQQIQHLLQRHRQHRCQLQHHLLTPIPTTPPLRVHHTRHLLHPPRGLDWNRHQWRLPGSNNQTHQGPALQVLHLLPVPPRTIIWDQGPRWTTRISTQVRHNLGEINSRKDVLEPEHQSENQLPRSERCH